jgi:anti-repressor protein
MSGEIVPQVFDNEQFGQLRVITAESGESWFVAKDVCDALGIATNHIRESLDDDEISNLRTTEIGPEFGGKSPLIVSEAGLYSLVLKSRKPEAHAFKRWVTHEVLPAIRRDGGYMVARDETPEETMARAVLIARRTIDRQRAQIDEMRPKAFFADSVAQASTSVLVGVLAKILRQNGYETGQNRLFKQLCADGYLIGRKGRSYHMPTQRAAEMGLFEVKESTHTHSDGHTSIDRTTLVTGKGQVYFVNRYCGRGAA